jgi:hypothetical protein
MTTTTATTTCLINRAVLDGSPSHQTEEVISEINNLGHLVEIVFESGCFAALLPDEVHDLIDDGEVRFTDANHGGMRVITLGRI